VENLFYAALMIGLLGSTHCVGMCGGIVGALSAGLKPDPARPISSLAGYHIAYNAGRILSYTAAGGAIGLLGSQIDLMNMGATISVGRLIAGLFMIALGLYLAGWWQAITLLEKGGAYVWRWIEPLGRRFLPVRSPLQALGLGLIWGWLPCGLVYSTLVLAMTSMSAAQGALIMLGFGLGTLPVLLTLGNVAGNLRALARHPLARRIAGGGIIIFGLYACFTAFDPAAHDHATGDPATGGDLLRDFVFAPDSDVHPPAPTRRAGYGWLGA